MSSPSMSAPASPSASAGSMSEPFGTACSSIPKTGKGSFDGMSQDPVATAASNNPALSTLVTAVKAAGLVDTLNTADDITVFAPTNDAFAAMDQATLKKALADPKGLLTTVLTVPRGRRPALARHARRRAQDATRHRPHGHRSAARTSP